MRLGPLDAIRIPHHQPPEVQDDLLVQPPELFLIFSQPLSVHQAREELQDALRASPLLDIIYTISYIHIHILYHCYIPYVPFFPLQAVERVVRAGPCRKTPRDKAAHGEKQRRKAIHNAAELLPHRLANRG